MDWETLQQLFALETWIGLASEAWDWLKTVVLSWPVAGQIAVSAATLVISVLLAKRLRRRLAAFSGNPVAGWAIRLLRPLLAPILWLLLSLLALAVAGALGQPSRLLEGITGLLLAWVAIKLVSQLVRNPFWAGLFVWTAWTIAALNILGWLDSIVLYLQNNNVPGSSDVSLFEVVVAVFVFLIFVSAGVFLTRTVEARIKTSRSLSPSAQVLLVKTLKIVLVSVAVLVAIDSLGISLTALAVVGGVVGVGIGFGLQKPVSNLISGLILLVDNSIKPGDVISVAGTYGWVTALGGRYVSVVTRDGVEHLIPNELLISERVENWTHTHSRTRLKVDVRVHFRTDLRKAMALCLDSARETERVLADPDPKCLLLEFGDSAIKLQTRFWIADAHNGVQNVKSDVLLRIWEKFGEAGIEIPYPQRDLNLRSGFAGIEAAAGKERPSGDSGVLD